MKNFFRLLLLFFLVQSAIAQNAQQFTNYTFNQLTFNPAYTGFDNAIQATALYRTQWTGVNGNPAQISFAAHSPLNFANSNAGIYVMNDMMGAQRVTHFHLSYAYRKTFSFGNISLGVSAGLFQQQLRGNELKAPQGDYSNGINHNDDLIPNSVVNTLVPEFNTGIYFNTKGLQLGISANNISSGNSKLETATGITSINFNRFYTALGLYNISLGKKLTLIPSALLKTDFIFYQTDFTLILQHKNNIYLGTAFRGNSSKSIDAASVLFGFNVLKNIRIGYSYDISVSGLNTASNGSHELFVNYRLPLKDLIKPGKKIYSPRFL